jgi:hypothetical protein
VPGPPPRLTKNPTKPMAQVLPSGIKWCNYIFWFSMYPIDTGHMSIINGKMINPASSETKC